MRGKLILFNGRYTQETHSSQRQRDCSVVQVEIGQGLPRLDFMHRGSETSHHHGFITYCAPVIFQRLVSALVQLFVCDWSFGDSMIVRKGLVFERSHVPSYMFYSAGPQASLYNLYQLSVVHVQNKIERVHFGWIGFGSWLVRGVSHHVMVWVRATVGTQHRFVGPGSIPKRSASNGHLLDI